MDKANTDLENISKWFQLKLSLNVKKSNFIILIFFKKMLQS